MHWTEIFLHFLSMIVGAINVPFACVVLATDIVDDSAPFELMEGTCYAEDAGSLEEELIKRASRVHPLFKEDNVSVYYMLEEATKQMVYSNSTKPFQGKKDGKNAWLSIVKQHAGDDQWKYQLEKSEDFINTKACEGNERNPLADHVSNIGKVTCLWCNVRVASAINCRMI